MSHLKIYAFIGIVLCTVIISMNVDDNNKSQEAINSEPTMHGVCWVAGDSIAEHNIEQVLDIGVNWISQTPFGWMDGHDSPKVVLSSQRGWWGERDEGIMHTAQEAKKKGVKTMLKPHIWIMNSNGKWRSDISMNSKEEWDQWFESYETWIMHYAVLAQKSGIEALCIGTEFYIATKKHPDRWRGIIANIRKVYSGDLTYAANWYKELETVTFWDDLDYIGVQAYFPISKEYQPSKKSLIRSWETYKKTLKKISLKYEKKIIFTEIGYKNTADAAIEPWTWPQRLDSTTIISNTTQKICYEALFESLWHEPWLEGFFIWKWFHTTYKYHDYKEYDLVMKERRRNWAKKRGKILRDRIHFTPQHTEAMDVLSNWYRKEHCQP